MRNLGTFTGNGYYMKTILTALLLLLSFMALAQASGDMKYDITFTNPNKHFKNTELFLLAHRGAVNFEKCTYNIENIAFERIKIRLQGQYTYVLGPHGFLATICLSQKYKSDSGIEEIQNYFVRLIDIDCESTTLGVIIKCDLGDIAIDEIYPFIKAKKISGQIKAEYEPFQTKENNIEIANWTKMQFRKQ